MKPSPSTNHSKQLHHNAAAASLAVKMTYIAAIIYSLLLIYGTLFPMSGWLWNLQSPSKLFQLLPIHASRTDVVTNFLVYIPFGLLLSLIFPPRISGWIAIISVTCVGSVLSFTLEYLQLFLPGRVSSIVDVALNTVSCLIGATIAATFRRHTRVMQILINKRSLLFNNDVLTNLSLASIGLWALSQIMPLFPSIDVGELKNGIKPIWYTLTQAQAFKPWKLAAYSGTFVGLGLIYRSSLKNYYSHLGYFYLLIAFVLLLKILIVTRALSLEAVCAFTLSALILSMLGQVLTRSQSIKLAFVCVLSTYLINGLHSETVHYSSIINPINWIPFFGHMKGLNGLIGITELLWPFVALAYLINSVPAIKASTKTSTLALTASSAMIFVGTLLVEWLQQYIPGRYPDITAPCIATLTFVGCGWYYVKREA